MDSPRSGCAAGLPLKIRVEVTTTQEMPDGLQVSLPQEPMIVGAVGAAVLAFERAGKSHNTTSESATDSVEQGPSWGSQHESHHC